MFAAYPDSLPILQTVERVAPGTNISAATKKNELKSETNPRSVRTRYGENGRFRDPAPAFGQDCPGSYCDQQQQTGRLEIGH